MSATKNRPTQLVDMGKLLSLTGKEPLLLQQIAGPGAPRDVKILPAREVVLGRDDTCQVMLDEDPVSRKHARIRYAGERPELLDLGSKNGTFHNGKAVHRAFLNEADEIQVGTSVFRVVLPKAGRGGGASDSEQIARAQDLVKRSAPGSSSQASAISGQLSEIRLMSLLQVIESDGSTGTLVVLDAGQEGKLYVHRGEIRHATFGRARGRKALYRLTALTEGRFDFYIPGRSPEYHTIEGGIQTHLLEAMRQQDEFAVYRERLPPPGSRLVFNPAKHIVPAKVPPAVFDVLASVGYYQTVGEVIDSCPLPDSDIGRILLALLKHGVVSVAD